MSHTSPNRRKLSDETEGQGSESDLRALFQRTTPGAPPLEAARLVEAARNARAPPHVPARWALGAAAAMLFAAGGTCGWWLAWGSAGEEVARLEETLAATRAQITEDLCRALRVTQKALLEEQEESIKRVALLVRGEYAPRLAALESELKSFAMLVAKRE